MKKGAKGFDISHHQDVTEAEMRAAKASGFEFVVIRASHGMTCIDEKFKRHYEAARAAGLFIFVYFYLYYADKIKSAREVQNVLNVIKGLTIDGCVFIDMEHRGEYDKSDYLSSLSKAECTDRALYAIEEITRAGFNVGIYADVDWMENEMEMSRIPGNVLIWCADWHGELDYHGRCEMRQYTSKGTIAGIGTGSVDLNMLLVDYPLTVPEAPAGAVGKIINCVFWCKRRSGPSTKTKWVGKAERGLDVFINGKRIVEGVTWYHDSAGNWIHSKFVRIDDSKVPYM